MTVTARVKRNDSPAPNPPLPAVVDVSFLREGDGKPFAVRQVRLAANAVADVSAPWGAVAGRPKFIVRMALVAGQKLPADSKPCQQRAGGSVPVTIDNMPAARQFQVLCAVYNTVDGTGTTVNTIGGWGSPRIDISGGRYAGPPVVVEFGATDTRAPSEALSYSCNVVVFGVGPEGRAFEAGGSVFASTWRARTVQTVTLDPA